MKVFKNPKFDEEAYPVKNRCKILNEDIRKEIIEYLDKKQNFFKKNNLSKINVEANKIVYAINSHPDKHRHIVIIPQASIVRQNNILGPKLFFMVIQAEINDPTIKTYDDVVQILTSKKSVSIHPFLTFKYYYCGNFWTSSFYSILPHFSDNLQYDEAFELLGVKSGFFFNIYVESFIGYFSSAKSHLLGIRLMDSDDSKVLFCKDAGPIHDDCSGKILLEAITLNENGSIQGVFSDCFRLFKSIFKSKNKDKLESDHVPLIKHQKYD